MRLLPVIHPIGRHEAFEAVDLAVDLGVKGIFLINQGMTCGEVKLLARDIRFEYPDLWIGVNILGLPPSASEMEGTNGIWSDNAIGVARPNKRFIYFGGVDFKYQTPVAPENYNEVIKSIHVDVVTTSGPGTGKAPTLQKIKNFRKVYAGKLAIASGITPDNVDPFLPLVDYFLVATGIEKSFGVFDPSKLKALLSKLP